MFSMMKLRPSYSADLLRVRMYLAVKKYRFLHGLQFIRQGKAIWEQRLGIIKDDGK